MTLPEFDNCRSIPETNQVFKELFLNLKAKHDRTVADNLRDNHRKAMERIIYDLRASDEPTVQRQRSDADLHGPTVRNWALRVGLVLPKGRINKSIKDAYRQAHSDSPESTDVESQPQEIPSAAQVRSWARLEGIRCGERGRIHPDLLQQYKEAHQ